MNPNIAYINVDLHMLKLHKIHLFVFRLAAHPIQVVHLHFTLTENINVHKHV